jgi:hypothetical protein
VSSHQHPAIDIKHHSCEARTRVGSEVEAGIRNIADLLQAARGHGRGQRRNSSGAVRLIRHLGADHTGRDDVTVTPSGALLRTKVFAIV